MNKVKMLWMPLLLGALLISTLVGAAGARPEASPGFLDYGISAHHCIPVDDTDDWKFAQGYVECSSGYCNFVCPIKPPHQGTIRARRLSLYAYDPGGGRVCIGLVKVVPKAGTSVERLGVPCTDNSTTDPARYVYSPKNFKVLATDDLYVWVSFSGSLQKVYGFKLVYEAL
jgi:hypothetical protein